MNFSIIVKLQWNNIKKNRLTNAWEMYQFKDMFWIKKMGRYISNE